MFDQLQTILGEAKFLPAADPSQISQAEDALNFRMPQWLRDLYMHCNGIIVNAGSVYLYPLDKNEACSDSLVSWNQFQRDEWRFNLAALQERRPEIDWTVCDPSPLLIIGTVHEGLSNWAIRPGDAKTILCYDVRSEGCPPEVVAPDFFGACANHAKWSHDIEVDLLRGREFYTEPTNAKARDIDLLRRELTERSAPGTVPGQYWHIRRATSQRTGEYGELFIISIAAEELRIASRDGDLPFAMRLNVWSIEDDLSCVVWSIKETADRILAAKDAVWLPWTDGNRPRPNEALLRQVWRDSGNKDPELDRIADMLCKRDDHRLEEENRLG